jgi:ABC-type proline/glycine betaine transport system permease subunit
VSFWQFLQSNWPELLLLVRQHVVLVFVAILIEVLFGFPTGRLLKSDPKFKIKFNGIDNEKNTHPTKRR